MRRPPFCLFILTMLFLEMAAPILWAQNPPSQTASIDVSGGSAHSVLMSFAKTPPARSATPEQNNPTDSNPKSALVAQKRVQKAPAVNGNACEFYSMSDAERNQLHQFLFGSNGAFRGDLESDLSDLNAVAAQGSNPTDPFSLARKQQNAQNPNPNSINMFDIAALKGMDAKSKTEIAKIFNVYDYQKNQIRPNVNIPIEQAKKILAKQPPNSPYQDIFNQIQDYINSATNSKAAQAQQKERTKELAPYERYKVIMPGSGKEVSLADIFQAQKIDPDSCMLKNEIINGRVGYIAVLDSDITYGTKNTPVLNGNQVSPATGKSIPELVSLRGGELNNNHLFGNSMTGYLDLNGGDNLIVPEFYRDWIVFSTAYTRADFYASMLFSAVTLYSVKNLETVKKNLEDRRNNIATRDPNAVFANEIATQISGAIQRDAFGHDLVKPFTVAPTPGGLQGGIVQAIGIEQVQTNAGLANVLRYYGPNNQRIKEVQGIGSIEKAIQYDPALQVQRQGGLVKEISDANINIAAMKKLKSATDARVATSFYLAGGWLGPARMAFTLNNGILFRAQGQQGDKFLRLLVSKDVLKDFKSSTGFLALGKIQETIAQYFGIGLVPEKAFFAKNVLILNYPQSQKSENSDSTTSFQSEDDGSFAINTRWRGQSYALNMEDMRGFSTKSGASSFTSLDMVSNNILAEPSLQDKNLHSLTALFSLAIPWIASRKLFELQERSLGVGIFLSTLEFLDINQNVGSDVRCNKDDYEQFKNKYRMAFAGSVLVSSLSVASVAVGRLRQFLHQTSVISSATSGIIDILNTINPPELWRFYIGNQAIGYTSNCQDQMNTILTWQPIPDNVVSKTTNALDKMPPIQDQISKLGLSKFLDANPESAQAQAQLKNLKNVLNFRAVLQDQGGLVRTPELLYIHIGQSTSSIKGGLYDLVASACGEDRLSSKDGRSVTFGNGLEANNPDGSKALSFQSDIWKLRAMARNKNYALSRVIIPNTIIQSNLMGGSDPFLEIASTGQSTLINPPCDLRNAILKLTGRDIGNDFTQAIGTVRTIETSQGQADILNGQIDYVDRNGIGTTVPTADELSNAITTGGRISIRNNGQVVLYGAQSSSQQPIGTLVSLIGDNGALHYNPATAQISLIIYSIFETSNQNIQNWNIRPRGDGAEIQVQAKRGFEDSAQKLNAGLDKIAGTDGIKSFETKDKIYYITPDGKLRVIDKNTGAATDYNITGKPYTDGNGNLVIPTDKGPVTFSLNNQNGQPTLATQGPNGLNDLGALLAARGQNGILTFNPSTGAINVYNGQDVPMNPAFQNGIGFSGNKDGTTTAVASDSPFLAPSAAGSGTSSDTAAPKLFLPSWPEQWPWATFLVGIILVGVIFIRFRQTDV